MIAKKCLVLLFLVLSVSEPGVFGHGGHSVVKKCGDRDPPIKLIKEVNDQYIAWEGNGNDNSNRMMLGAAEKKFVVTVHFHVMDLDDCDEGCDGDGCCDDISDKMIRSQMDVLNDNFAGKDKFQCKYEDFKSQDDSGETYVIAEKDWKPPTKPAQKTAFQFKLGQIQRGLRYSMKSLISDIQKLNDRSTLEQLVGAIGFGANDLGDESIDGLKEYLVDNNTTETVFQYFFAERFGRFGDCRELNVWILSSEDATKQFLEDSQGVATFPWSCKRTAAESVADGVTLSGGTMPGGYGDGSLGDLFVHEVGHWLGLFHTFNGGDGDDETGWKGCEGEGDEIQDTPMEARAAFQCPIGRDTCPGLPGVDPIHNYMDYTDDCCEYTFTAQQAKRMEFSYEAFRGKAATNGGTKKCINVCVKLKGSFCRNKCAQTLRTCKNSCDSRACKYLCNFKSKNCKNKCKNNVGKARTSCNKKCQ